MVSQNKTSKAEQKAFEDRFEKSIALILELSKQGVPIVVEGIKDITALRGLGLVGPIHALSGHNIVSLADALADSKRLLILFDFDRRGGQLARQLSVQLEGRGVTILHKERTQLRKAFSWRTRVIEGLKPIDQPQKGTKF